MTKRLHQIEMTEVVESILSGAPIDRIIVDATPGAGKSSLPAEASRLIPKVADRLLWVVPRKSLQYQAEGDFIDPFFRNMFGHTATIRSSTNDIDPCRGLEGFTTTYQAIGVDEQNTVLNEVRSKRYIVVLDEFHHAEDGGIWHQKLAPIIREAKLLVLMTGTLMRGDGHPIAYMPYRGGRPCIEGSETTRVIQYTREMALEEKAIIPLRFHFRDAQVSWMNEIGQTIDYESLAKVTKKDAQKAIYTAVDTQYAVQMLDQAFNHWTAHRFANPRSKLLVVTAGKKHATAALKHLKSKRVSVDIATSHESAAAQKAIRRFKEGEIDALVTIAMAYEGLSVREITHIVSLTHIRSLGWLIQMLARAVRVQLEIPYELQEAHVFAPDDPLMRAVVAQIQAEQLPFLKKRAPKVQQGLFEEKSAGHGDPEKNPLGIIPLGSRLTNGRQYSLGAQPEPPQAPAIPSDIEADLREKIEAHVRRFCWINRYKEQKINTELRGRFGKPRGEMTIPELKMVHGYITKNFSLIRPARGTGQRVSRKPVRYYGEAFNGKAIRQNQKGENEG